MFTFKTKRACDNPGYQGVNALSLKELQYRRAKCIINLGVKSPTEGVYEIPKELILHSEVYSKEELNPILRSLNPDKGYLMISNNTKTFFSVK